MRLFFREGPVGYAAPPVALGLAVLAAFPFRMMVPYSAEYIFLIAVVAAGWIAGRGPGLVTAVFAPLTLGYFYLSPLYTLEFSAESRRLMFPFLIFAMGAAWLSGTLGKANSAQSALRQNQKRFAQILANLPDLAWTMSREGKIAYISPSIATLTGFSSSEFYEGGLRFLLGRIHQDDREPVIRAGKELFTEGRHFDVEFRFRKRDEKWIWLNGRTSGTFQAGINVLADGVITDISLRKAAEVELKSKTALLEAQLNATIDGILVIDSSGQRVLHNRRFVELFKIPLELLHTNDHRPFMEYATSLIKNPEEWLNRVKYLYSHPMETSHDEFELKDGTILERYSSPVVDEAGSRHGRIWVFHDITVRKNNEDRLRQLSLVVEQSPAAVVITDPKGSISYVNRKFTESTGYTADEVLGKNPRILNSGHSSLEAYQELWKTITQGGSWRGEFRNRKKSGELYWETATITPIFNSEGEITNFLALKEDITSRRLTEKKLENVRILADEANRSLRAKHLALEGERQILHALIDNVPDFMFVKDTQSKFVVANAQTARALRAGTPKDLVGKTDFDFFPPEMAKAFFEDEQEVLRTGEPLYNREEAALDENGNQIQILTTKVPVRDGQGKITGIAGVGRIITARKQMENALREAEQKFRGIFDNAVIGIFQSTPEGRLLSVNPSMATIFGYDSPEEMVTLITDIENQLYVKSTDRADFKARVATVGGVQSYVCEGFRKDGSRIWLSMSVRAIFEDDVPIRFEGMCEDITERRAMESQLRQAQKLEGIGQLAAGIAHEINTPIQFVADNLAFLRNAWSTTSRLLDQYRNYGQDCADNFPPDVVSKFAAAEKDADWEFISSEVPNAVDQALDGVHRVAQIVKAMKEFSHPDSLDKIQVDLNQAIESTITVARSEWKYVADVDRDFDASLPLIVCYPGEINQVILNLLVNAAHAIGDKVRDGKKGTITVRTRARGPYAELAITDTGTGIPSSIQTRIFEPFFTTKDVGKGTGQGLALAHSIVVKKHRGKIWFDSEVGIGTTFFVDIPLGPDGMGRLK